MREGLEKKARSIVELDEKCESALIAAITKLYDRNSR